MNGTGCEKCYKLSRCFEQRGRCAEYRDIEEIRQEIQIVMQSSKSAEASASSDEGCDGERED